MMSIKHSNIAILNIKSVDYCCFIRGISESEAINIMHNSDLTEKSRTLSSYVTMRKKILTFGGIEIENK